MLYYHVQLLTEIPLGVQPYMYEVLYSHIHLFYTLLSVCLAQSDGLPLYLLPICLKMGKVALETIQNLKFYPTPVHNSWNVLG